MPVSAAASTCTATTTDCSKRSGAAQWVEGMSCNGVPIARAACGSHQGCAHMTLITVLASSDSIYICSRKALILSPVTIPHYQMCYAPLTKLLSHLVCPPQHDEALPLTMTHLKQPVQG